MVGRRLRLPALEGAELSAALLAAALTAALALAGAHKLGAAGILAPLALVAVGILLARPVLAVTLVVALVIVCEGPTFGILTFTSHLYTNVYKYLSVLDLLVVIAVVSVGFDVVRHRRALWWPGPLRLPFAILALAMIGGVVVGSANANGAGLRYVIVSEHVLAYLLFLPIAVANLDLDPRRIRQLLIGLLALAVVKSALGLIEVAGHYGASIEGASTLTYYEPAANWLILIALLGILGVALRARPPLAVLLASPLLVACLLFSYRRSFWVAAVLGLLLVLLLGTSSAGRRLLLPAGIAVAAAIWLLGSIAFQSQLPIVKRAESLTPTKLEANREDRYRLDERANVLGEIREHPITGLGMTIPWDANVQPLSVEHEEGRQYVHFAALWFWLKLGLLGLCAYVGIVLGSMALAWRVWRSSHDLLPRAFGLASLAGIAGLIVMDTTASFTGVDARFTVLFAAQLGVLALLARPGRSG